MNTETTMNDLRPWPDLYNLAKKFQEECSVYKCKEENPELWVAFDWKNAVLEEGKDSNLFWRALHRGRFDRAKSMYPELFTPKVEDEPIVVTREPTLPGAILKDFIEEEGCPLEDVAWGMKLEESLLEGFIKGEVPCTKGLADKISKWTDTPPTFWLNLQAAHDKWVSDKELPVIEEEKNGHKQHNIEKPQVSRVISYSPDIEWNRFTDSLNTFIANKLVKNKEEFKAKSRSSLNKYLAHNKEQPSEEWLDKYNKLMSEF